MEQCKILLVEDDEVILNLLKEILENNSYHVECAHNGQEALEILRNSDQLPSLILLDLMMPLMDGFQFMREQTKDDKIRSIPVVAMSADSQIKEKLRGTTAQGYFKKPVKISTLLETIEHHCARTPKSN